jgi:hypothetical protein
MRLIFISVPGVPSFHSSSVPVVEFISSVFVYVGKVKLASTKCIRKDTDVVAVNLTL